MKQTQNNPRQGLLSTVFDDVASAKSDNQEDNYAKGMVLSYLDELFSGHVD